MFCFLQFLKFYWRSSEVIRNFILHKYLMWKWIPFYFNLGLKEPPNDKRPYSILNVCLSTTRKSWLRLQGDTFFFLVLVCRHVSICRHYTFPKVPSTLSYDWNGSHTHIHTQTNVPGLLQRESTCLHCLPRHIAVYRDVTTREQRQKTIPKRSSCLFII